jgi:1,4-dihydroxy-2-naphthoyl-CoA hydrolase
VTDTAPCASSPSKVCGSSRQRRLCTRPAVLRGDAIMAFADPLGAAGTVLNLPEGAWTNTIESKTKLIGPAPLTWASPQR